jgi:hypothetical protein
MTAGHCLASATSSGSWCRVHSSITNGGPSSPASTTVAIDLCVSIAARRTAANSDVLRFGSTASCASVRWPTSPLHDRTASASTSRPMRTPITVLSGAVETGSAVSVAPPIEL